MYISLSKFHYSFFPPIIFISWRLITLQYRSGFCHTLTWISHGVTCVPHPEPPLTSPPSLLLATEFYPCTIHIREREICATSTFRGNWRCAVGIGSESKSWDSGEMTFSDRINYITVKHLNQSSAHLGELGQGDGGTPDKQDCFLFFKPSSWQRTVDTLWKKQKNIPESKSSAVIFSLLSFC